VNTPLVKERNGVYDYNISGSLIGNSYYNFVLGSYRVYVREAYLIKGPDIDYYTALFRPIKYESLNDEDREYERDLYFSTRELIL
jgi:hypothetical protein